jgi:hypothetical protein
MPRPTRQDPSDAVTELYERAVALCERHEVAPARTLVARLLGRLRRGGAGPLDLARVLLLRASLDQIAGRGGGCAPRQRPRRGPARPAAPRPRRRAPADPGPARDSMAARRTRRVCRGAHELPGGAPPGAPTIRGGRHRHDRGAQRARRRRQVHRTVPARRGPLPPRPRGPHTPRRPRPEHPGDPVSQTSAASSTPAGGPSGASPTPSAQSSCASRRWAPTTRRSRPTSRRSPPCSTRRDRFAEAEALYRRALVVFSSELRG